MFQKSKSGVSPIQPQGADHQDEQLDAPRQLSSEEMNAVAGGPQVTNETP